jgi:hypothetical protein
MNNEFEGQEGQVVEVLLPPLCVTRQRRICYHCREGDQEGEWLLLELN